MTTDKFYHIGVSIPSNLATSSIYIETIKQKILEGRSVNPEFRLLLDKLVDPAFENEKDFLKELISNILVQANLNIDAQQYLAWLQNNVEKIPRSEQFIKNSLDLYIRDQPLEYIKIQDVGDKSNISNIISTRKILTFNLIPYNLYFTGRENELSTLEQNFNKEYMVNVLTQSVKGPGGIGKTQLASQYVWKHILQQQKNTFDTLDNVSYDAVCWFHCETRDAFLKNYQELANELKIPFDNLNDNACLEALKFQIYQTFIQYKKLLLVFDNVESFDDYKYYESFFLALNKTKVLNNSYHVIVTSRAQNWKGLTQLALGVFSDADALNYIEKRFNSWGRKDFNPKDANLLIIELGGLALGLSQALAHILENDLSILNYLMLFKQAKKEALSYPSFCDDIYRDDENGHKLTVWTTWQVGINSLDADAQKLLKFCAYCSSENINNSMLTEWWIYTYQRKSFTNQNIPNETYQKINSLLSTLKNYSFLTLESAEVQSGPTYQIHRLLQDVVRLTQSAKEFELGNDKELILQILNFFIDTYEKSFNQATSWLPAYRDIEHANHAVNYISIVYATDIEIRKSIQKLLFGLTRYQLHYKISLGRCLQQLDKLKEMVIDCEGESSISYIKILNQIGSAYIELGEYLKSKEYHLKAINTLQKKYTNDGNIHFNIDYANAYEKLGIIERNLGNYNEAEEFLEKALVLYEDNNYIEIANIFLNLGLNKRNRGKFKEAEEFLKKTLAYYEKHYGSDQHIEIARVLSDLGNIQHNLKKYDEAKNSLQDALRIFHNHYKDDQHIDMARIGVWLGLMELNLGNYETAEKYYNQTVAIYEKHYRTINIDTIIIQLNLGYLAFCQAQFEVADLKFASIVKFNNQHHPALAQGYLLWALTNIALGKIGAAYKFCALAIEISEQHFKDIEQRHSRFSAIYGPAALRWPSEMVITEETEEILKFFLQEMSKCLPENHHFFAWLTYYLGLYYHKKEFIQEAIDSYGKALTIADYTPTIRRENIDLIKMNINACKIIQKETSSSEQPKGNLDITSISTPRCSFWKKAVGGAALFAALAITTYKINSENIPNSKLM